MYSILFPQESGSSDLSVLSVLGGSQVAASTDVFYLCQQYSLVFVLDMSPTMMAVVRAITPIGCPVGIPSSVILVSK